MSRRWKNYLRRPGRWIYPFGPQATSSAVTVRNNAEGGTAGVTPTPGNSGAGSGTAWDAVTVGGGTLTFDDTYPRNTLDYSFDPVSLSALSLRWDSAVGTQSIIYGRIYLFMDSVPDASLTVFRATSSAYPAMLAAIRVGTSGDLLVDDGVGSTIIDLADALQTGHWIRVEWSMDFNTGAAELRVFNNSPESAVPDQVGTGVGTFDGPSADTYRFGKVVGTVETTPFRLDDIGLSTLTWLGPTGVPYPPQFTHRTRPAPARRPRPGVFPLPPRRIATPPAPSRITAGRRPTPRPAGPAVFTAVPPTAPQAPPKTPTPRTARTVPAARRGQFFPLVPTTAVVAPAAGPAPFRVTRRPQPGLVRRGRNCFYVPVAPIVSTATPLPTYMRTTLRGTSHHRFRARRPFSVVPFTVQPPITTHTPVFVRMGL